MSNTIIATGRRKAAVARVYLQNGKGKFTVNNKSVEDYFTVEHLRIKALKPIKVLELTKKVDVNINVTGGGIKGQAEAVQLGLARAFVKMDPEYKPALKAENMMTRDARVVERKKPGLKKARRASQFSKR